MKSFVVIISIILSRENFAYGACEDDANFFFKGKEHKNCAWVSGSAPTRCKRFDPDQPEIIIEDYCDETCYPYLEDDPTYKFNNVEKKNCEWFSTRQDKCVNVDENGDEVKKKCKKACSPCQGNNNSQLQPLNKKDILQECM